MNVTDSFATLYLVRSGNGKCLVCWFVCGILEWEILHGFKVGKRAVAVVEFSFSYEGFVWSGLMARLWSKRVNNLNVYTVSYCIAVLVFRSSDSGVNMFLYIIIHFKKDAWKALSFIKI